MHSQAATVDRLYTLQGGIAMAPDKSMYSPGIDKGMPMALSCNAYLCNMFSNAKFYLQEAEHQVMFGRDYNKYGYVPTLYSALKKDNVDLLSGDTDLFADGSMRIYSTPGHTPGHCSLLLNLRNSGMIMLSADVAHDRYNFDNRVVPTINSDEAQSRNSMDKIDMICRAHNAQLWLNHDLRQQATIQHAPTWFD
jgi:N-acyl homoserine lactone hydrolase